MNKKSLHKEIIIRDRLINEDSPVYIIGEVACGHQGDVDQAKELIDSVADAGADAVQLEFFNAAANVVSSLPFYNLVENLSFNRDQWDDVVSHARSKDIALSAFVYDDVGLSWAIEHQPDFFKLNSSDISNPDLIIPIAQSGIPCTLGTGATSFSEIAETIDLVLTHGEGNWILQHGIQNFPTPATDAHINRIKLLRGRFDCLVMYADHTDANLEIARYFDLVAIGAGACAIEKHIVLDRKAAGVDWEAALEPQEFREYVEVMRMGGSALGANCELPLTSSDEKYRRFQKKSIVATEDIPAGTHLNRKHVAFLRSQGEEFGLTPMQFSQIEGRKTKNKIDKDSQVNFGDLEDV